MKKGGRWREGGWLKEGRRGIKEERMKEVEVGRREVEERGE